MLSIIHSSSSSLLFIEGNLSSEIYVTLPASFEWKRNEKISNDEERI